MKERLYWSASTKGFYSSAIHTEIPQDAVEVTEKEREALLVAEQAGKVIQAGQDGKPEAVDRVYSAEELKAMRNAPLLAQLAAIDARKARALTDALLHGDTTRLQALEDEAAALRAELMA